MLIGVPKEIKNHEYRVGLIPASVRELVASRPQGAGRDQGAAAASASTTRPIKAAGADHRAERRASLRQGRHDREGEGAAAGRVQDAAQGPDALHLPAPGAGSGADRGRCIKSGCTAIAYETVTNARGGLPLLAPMSEVAGRMSVQVGAHYLEKAQGGAGMLLGGVPGVPAANVVVIGGGVSGTNAARMAMGMEAIVTVIDKIARPPARARRAVRRQPQHHLLDRRCDRAVRDRRRPRHRRGAGAGRRGAEAGDAQDDQADAAGLGARRHRHRPGRLLRDQPRDHPRRSDLRGRRRHALLRRQHAGRGRAHLDLRAQQRHPALRRRARQQGRQARRWPTIRTC